MLLEIHSATAAELTRYNMLLGTQNEPPLQHCENPSHFPDTLWHCSEMKHCITVQ